MIVTTERLALRDYVEDDWKAVLAYQQDPRYLRYYPWTERSAEDVREFVQMFLDQQRAEPRIAFQLAATLRSDGQLIGSCGLRLKAAGGYEADIGYEIDPDYWGRGYATEAAEAMLAFGFREFQLHRISSWAIADNVASVRVLEKIGMKREGRLRENEFFKGRWWDTALWAILDYEWRAKQLRRMPGNAS